MAHYHSEETIGLYRSYGGLASTHRCHGNVYRALDPWSY